MDIEQKKCITPEFRVSFPNVFEAKSFKEQPAKYSVVMLFDKATDLKALKKAAFNAMIEKFGSKEKFPKKFRMPFRDGDDEKSDQIGYKNTIFVSASSKNRPGVVNGRNERLNAEDDAFYAGCYARAELIAFWYDQAGNKGVGFSLQNVQKTREGERFTNKKAPEKVFDQVEDSSDSEESYSTDSDMGF